MCTFRISIGEVSIICKQNTDWGVQFDLLDVSFKFVVIMGQSIYKNHLSTGTALFPKNETYVSNLVGIVYTA